MNVDLFKSLLRPYWQSFSINDLDDAADKIATAYDLSNIGNSAPFFGAKLIRGDKDTLKSFLSFGLKLNFNLKEKLPDPSVEPGFTLMATGFCLYWVSSTFSPVPPMPPMFAPTTGVQVLFPGIPIGLDKALKEAFNNTDIGRDYSRTMTFSFLRDDLVDASVNPELGDIIMYQEGYFEIEQSYDNQLFVGKDPDYPYNVNPLNPGLENFGYSVSINCIAHYIPADKVNLTKKIS